MRIYEQKPCPMCGNLKEPTQRTYCVECAKKRLAASNKASWARQNEKRRQIKQAEKRKASGKLTITEVVLFAKEHGLHNNYGRAVAMLEAERKAKPKSTKYPYYFCDEDVVNNGVEEKENEIE